MDKEQNIGKISISRVSSNMCDDYVSIKLQDSNFKMVFNVEMSFKDFGECITGLGMVTCCYKEWLRSEK